MRKQNDGQNADDILQNQFTAYLVTAVKRRKAHYIRKRRSGGKPNHPWSYTTSMYCCRRILTC